MSNINVQRVVVLSGQSIRTDILIIDLPFVEGVWPFKNLASAKIEVASGRGVEFAKKNFPDTQIVNICADTGIKTIVSE